MPGDVRPAFEHSAQSRQVLNDAEEDLREWTPSLDAVPSAATEMGSNLMPSFVTGGGASTVDPSVAGGEEVASPQQLESPLKAQRDVSGSTAVGQETGYQQQ